MGTDAIIFKLTPVNRIGTFAMYAPTGALIGKFNSLGASLETIAEQYGLDAQVNWYWEGYAHEQIFEPMTVRQYFWALRPDKKEKIAATIARLEESGKMGAFG